jgi:hypothetical protein
LVYYLSHGCNDLLSVLLYVARAALEPGLAQDIRIHGFPDARETAKADAGISFLRRFAG